MRPATAAVLAGALAAFGGAAVAGTYTAGNQAALVAAINNANADADASATITLTGSFAVTAPLPQVTKPVLVNSGGFVITVNGAQPFNVATGSSLTFQGVVNGTNGLLKNGNGSLVLAGIGATAGGTITVANGELRVQDGGTLTSTALTGILATGDNTRIVVTGSGSRLATTTSLITIGSAAGSSLDVLAGGSVGVGSALSVGDTAGTTGTLTVQGSGSSVIANSFRARSGQSNIRLLDGGTLETTGGTGVQLGTTGGVANVVVGGNGSKLTSAGSYLHNQGTLEVSNGGTLSVRAAANLGNLPGGFTGLVTGAGSLLETLTAGNIVLGGTTGSATLTVSNGGTISSRAGAGNVNLAQGVGGTAVLNIGAAVGDAPTAPGTVIALQVVGGAGAATLNFNHNASAYTFAAPITGTTRVNQIGSGTTTLTGANTYTGATGVTGGTLRAGVANTFSSASAFTVGAGGTLDLSGNNQTLASVANAGSVLLAGGTLTVKGPWVGNGGTLGLDTALAGSGSATGRLLLDGAAAVASGTTNVQITNIGGLGALTSGDGVEVVSGINGATTTAQTTKNAFVLAGGHVDAGAYEYRLFAADANGAGQNWYLRSTIAAVAPVGGAAAGALVPAYRAEVPMYAVIPEQFRQADLAMLGNLGQRVGADASEGDRRQAWGRFINTDRRTSQAGTANPASKGRLTGLQAGTDLWTDPAWHAGVYAGQLDGGIGVNGAASGQANLAVGTNNLKGQYLGFYGTWKNGGGLYVDSVLQAGRYSYNASPALGGVNSSGKGSSLLASAEVGQSFPLADNWRIEPQLQLVHQRMSLDDTGIVGAVVQQHNHNGWLVRAGVQVKGDIATASGVVQPYVRGNLYRSSSGTDVTSFIGPAGPTDIATRTGGTSSELALGASWQLTPATSLYGELSKLWDVGGDARISSGVSGSVGVRVLW